MSIHTSVTEAEAADRLALRELVDAYAHCADRRDAKGQMALFTEDTHFVVHMDARDPEPTQELHDREALAPVFDALNAYAATMHFNGQSTIELQGDRAMAISCRVRLVGRWRSTRSSLGLSGPARSWTASAGLPQSCTASRMSMICARPVSARTDSVSSSRQAPVMANGRTSRSGAARASARSTAAAASCSPPSSR
ncbi:nuclear transport factor 2 family protein [Streptomyces sp. NPDC002143]